MEEKSSLMSRRAYVSVEVADEGMRLDLFLAGRFTYHSRTEWQKIISDGKIRINDRTARPSRKLNHGDRIEYDTAGIEEPEVDARFETVFSDENIVVVSKPGNLPCHPAGIFFRNTLWRLMTEQFGKIYFINRIDRETSGLVLAARNPETASILSAPEYEIRKKYIAYVHGDFNAVRHAKGYLGPDRSAIVRKKRLFSAVMPPDADNAEYAETFLRPVFSDGRLSIVEAELVTGRLHQIRATLCSLGFPLVGDKIYGLDPEIYVRFVEDRMTDGDRKLLVMGRQALHSSQLEFRHPLTGAALDLRSELPEDMRWLRQN